MSMHKQPLTDMERAGLEKHRLPIGTPSQLADCLRLGVRHAIEAQGVPDVDALAQFIREIDGAHRFGAGALAERICAWLASAPPVPQAHETSQEPVVEGFVKRACPYCESTWYGQRDDQPAPQVDVRIADAVEHYGGVKSDEELFPAQASVVQQEPVARIHTTVTGCDDCPSCVYETAGRYSCEKSGYRKFDGDGKTAIAPDWCPLPFAQQAKPQPARAIKILSQGEWVLYPLSMREEALRRGWTVRDLVPGVATVPCEPAVRFLPSDDTEGGCTA